MAFSRRGLLLTGVGATVVAGISATPAFGRPFDRDLDGSLVRKTVLESGESGIAAYRIPGVATTVEGTILVFAEGRTTLEDASPHHIVLKRSTDGGHAWGPLQILERSDGTQSFVNPTVVVDRSTGRICVLYDLAFKTEPDNHTGSADASRVFARTSEDDGRTWSKATEITSLFAANPNDWTMHNPGPGHGIQLESGRLMVQVWHRRQVTYPVAERRYGVSVIYSDDHGTTWKVGGRVPVDSSYPVNESRIFQRPDGAVVFNGRYAVGGANARISAVSTDDGMTWSDPALNAAVRPYVGVDSGLVRLSGGLGSRKASRIITSRPDATVRRNLTVAVSYDEGASYAYSRVVDSDLAAYSDLTVLPDHDLGLIYERGRGDEQYAEIAFVRFDLGWLTQGRDHWDDLSPQQSIELESQRILDSSGDAVSTVDEAGASGGATLKVDSDDYDDHVTLDFRTRRGGHYDVRARYRLNSAGAKVAVSIDGIGVGGAVDTSIQAGRAYLTEYLGTVQLSAGRHRLRLAVVGTSLDSGGTTMDLDLVTLVRH